MVTSNEQIVKLELIQRALTSARVYVAGHDQAQSAYNQKDRVIYSALRSLVEQAEEAVAVLLHAATSQVLVGDEPCYQPPGRDGGPADYR